MVGRMDIGTILATLNRHKIRVTYSAIGQLLNIPAIAVGRRLGDKGPEKSWVVSSRTGFVDGVEALNIVDAGDFIVDWLGNRQSSLPFNGKIFKVPIFTRALSASEIKDISASL